MIEYVSQLIAVTLSKVIGMSTCVPPKIVFANLPCETWSLPTVILSFESKPLSPMFTPPVVTPVNPTGLPNGYVSFKTSPPPTPTFFLFEVDGS